MGTQDRSQFGTGEYVQEQVRLLRIASRWQLIRMKGVWRQFDATTSEARTQGRQWANTAHKRGGVEIREFYDETNKHFENAKPEIRAWVQKLSNHAELIVHKLSNAIRYATKGAVLILVMLGVIWLSGSWWSDASSNMPVGSEDNQGIPSVVADLDDEDWDDSTGRTPNDDRSDSLNPNNDAYQASTNNRSGQMNPNNEAYHSSRR